MAQAISFYVARPSGIHRLHPLTRLVIVSCLLVGGLVLPGMWTTYIIFLVVLVPLAIGAQIFRNWIHLTWRVVLPFTISVFIIQGFLWTGGTPILFIGPLSLKQEGLEFAIASTGRILIVVGSFIWFALTTRPDTLMISLVQRGFPANLAYIIVATIQIIPRFQARAASILDAQRARGLETEGSLRTRARAIIPLVAPLILSSLVDVEERALAIEARGFNHPGVKTSFVTIAETRWEVYFRWLLLLLSIGMIGFRVWYQTR